jgi:hypothetical protein
VTVSVAASAPLLMMTPITKTLIPRSHHIRTHVQDMARMSPAVAALAAIAITQIRRTLRQPRLLHQP